MYPQHSFVIPVMGICFTIDSPIKVARYGISSVISLVDDTLIEEMRKYYSGKFGEPYTPISKDDDDYRAKRITAYLNLLDRIIQKQFHELKHSAFETGSEITKYFQLLPETSPLKTLYRTMLSIPDPVQKKSLQDKLRGMITVGRVDVNIMTKLDRPNYSRKDGSLLPAEYSDALAALRGFAKSKLESAVVLSAGFNRRLYTYIAEFKDFYTDQAGRIKKKIILKVSDYRSSIIQGKFFAKKGLWVSEFRVESGLNCGGHTFVGSGQLLGPILEEFRNRKTELVDHLRGIYRDALKTKKIDAPAETEPLDIAITAQGGIGTPQEDQFLRSYYHVAATGWGTPFLLCPEVTTLDDTTLHLLQKAGKDELEMSDVSPLNVMFNNLKTSASEVQKNRRIKDGKPGSPCPKGHLATSTEFTEKPLCTASRSFQRRKIEQLKTLNLSPEQYQLQYKLITAKSCICHELGAGAMIKYGIPFPDKLYPAVCPGPNLEYFSKIVTLQEMADHIYDRAPLPFVSPRPHMFLQEAAIYFKFFVQSVDKALTLNSSDLNFTELKNNLSAGIDYYLHLFQTEIKDMPQVSEGLLALRDQFRSFLESCPEKIFAPASCNS